MTAPGTALRPSHRPVACSYRIDLDGFAHASKERARSRKAHEAQDHLLATALDKSEALQMRLADYHKASPELAWDD